MAVERDQFTWFYPDHVEVGVPTGEDVKAKFSRFSVPKDYLPTGFRGIVDIDFEPKDPNVNVVIHVYVLKHEEGKKIHIYKDGKWIELDTLPFILDRRGIWTGYLEATTSAGDPPIAVG